MNNNKSPKYDNDLVNLGYLKKILLNGSEETQKIISKLPKSYNSPPPPPYYVGSILYYEHQVYRCNHERLQGSFNWEDWASVASDNEALNHWVEYVYSVDKLQLEAQIDEKIQTYYQSADPNEWTTDLEKAQHVGDYWYKTTDNTQWRWTALSTNPITYAWQQVNVPNAIFDLIDTKKSIYTSKPSSYNQDDLWIIEDTLSDADLPTGVQKGDWVFATTDSSTYNKAHWVKRDENVSLEYLQNHYYTTSEIESKITTINSSVDSKITQAKNEINLNVSQTYTTLETFNQQVLDYDEVIGEISETVETHDDSISNLTVDVNSISSAVYSNNETITNELERFKQTVSTQFTQTNNDFLFQFNSLTELIDSATNTESEHYEELQKYIRFINGIIVLGQLGNQITAELSNTKLAFKSNGIEIAYISNDKLYIKTAEIIESLIIGNFGFVPKSNGSLSFKKVK